MIILLGFETDTLKNDHFAFVKKTRFHEGALKRTHRGEKVYRDLANKVSDRKSAKF